MDKRKIAVFVGSLREGSFNRQLARALERLGEDRLEFDHVDIGSLPFYNQDFDGDYPQEGIALKAQVRAADAVLFVTPEYNRSVPGVLKNAIDWATRPAGHSSLTGKPTAVTGASKGVISTALAQNHLKAILVAQGAPLVGAPEVYIRITDDFFTEDGAIANEGTREFLTAFLQRLHELIRRWQ